MDVKGWWAALEGDQHRAATPTLAGVSGSDSFVSNSPDSATVVL